LIVTLERINQQYPGKCVKAEAVDEDGHRVVPSEETKQPNGEHNTMADEMRIGLAQLLRKAHMDHDADFLKEGVRALSQALMEMEVEEHIGAGRHERAEGRSGHRNGYRERTWDTRAGAIELKVPRVRDGSYFPSLLEPRRRAERALSAVVHRRRTCTGSPHARWMSW
jgi:Transposase, Mutator family